MKIMRLVVFVLAVVLVVGCTPKTPKKEAPAPNAPMTQTTVKEMPANTDVQPKALPAAEVWTCPMHPEVKEAKAGKCPKCGMDLVKAAATAPAPAPMSPPAAVTK